MSLPINPAFVTTTSEIAGWQIVRTLGVAEGIAVTLFTGFLGVAQQEVLRQTMAEAFMDMLAQAAGQGANAIIGLHYALPPSQAERIVIAYGTAVIVEKEL